MASSEKTTEGASKSSPALRKGRRPRKTRGVAPAEPKVETTASARPAPKPRAATRTRSRKTDAGPVPSTASRVAKPASDPVPGPTEPARAISATERHRMIAELAYLRAERRGFKGGSAERDWFEAASEVDALLIGRSGRTK